MSFSEDERRLLAHVLDEIIPPHDDGRLPGAGELGVATHVENALGTTPDLARIIADGLAALENIARRRAPRGFAALSREERLAVLNELAPTEHAFPPIFYLQAYAGYYHHPRVLEVLGLDPRPPHPQGYRMEPDDLTLLEKVRQRPKMYRPL